MITITALRPSKRDSERIYIDFDSRESIRSTASVITELALYVGRELDEEEYAELLSQSKRSGAYAAAARVISHRPVSKNELVDKLRQKGEDLALAEEAADRLEELGAIDDGQYAVTVARHYAARGYGPGRVKSELSRRRVPREYWDEAIAAMPQDDEAIYALLKKSMRGEAPDRKSMKRAGDALYRRGFSWEQISAACSRYEQEYGENTNT